MNVLGVAQGQMVGSVIRKKLDAVGSGYNFFGGSSEANRGQFHQEKVVSTAYIFL